MNWKALFSNKAMRTVAHAAFGGAAVALATYDPSQPITAHTVLVPVAASAATSVISLYSDNPLGQSIIALAKALLASKEK
jgi:hypothetical protein